MRISTEQLAQRLQRMQHDGAVVYVVFGAETLLPLEAADRIRAAARTAGYTEREVLTAESGFNWNRLGMSAASLSLFGTRKLLELRIPNGKPGVEGAKALEQFIASP